MSSFFVADTVEVDRNVSRHVGALLRDRTLWDVAVLHLLGLDHAGHLVGPRHALLHRKAREVDALLSRIHALLDRRTLLVLASDHGMTDAGNHGGASAHEADALLLFAWPGGVWVGFFLLLLICIVYINMYCLYHFLCFGICDLFLVLVFHDNFCSTLPLTYLSASSLPRSTRCEQTDLAPTLAALTGVPVPRASIGRPLRAVLAALPPRRRLTALAASASQLLALTRRLPCGATSSAVAERAEECRTLAGALRGLDSPAAAARHVDDALDCYWALLDVLGDCAIEQVSGV